MRTIEELPHAYYAGDNDALAELVDRLDPFLGQIAAVILQARGVPSGALDEWDIDERLAFTWAQVALSRAGRRARWAYERWSALRWLINVSCEEMDRDMDFRPHF